jgi:hypothetical protein
MTAPRLPRRLVVGLTSAALLGGVVGVVPLLGSASAAGCPTWTDTKGDAMWHEPLAGQADPTGATADAQMDIVSSTLGSVGDSLVGTITSDGLSDSSSDLGDEFGFDFTVAGVELNFYADRSSPQGAPLMEGTAGILGPNVEGEATVTYDVAKKTVTIKAKLTEVAKAAEKAVANQSVTAISSYTKDTIPLVPLGFGQPLIEYDRSTTPLTTVMGADCAGGSTPAPTGTTTTSPSPSPSPTTTTPPPVAGTLFDQPRKNCFLYKDASGDADPTPIGADPEDSLDITTVNLKSPTGQLQFFVGITDPAAATFPLFTGSVYEVAFTVGGKAVTLTASADGPAEATVAGAANTVIKATAKIDAAKKNVVFTVPLDGLSTATATTIAKGTAITGTAITTSADSPLGAQEADTAAGTTDAQKTYAYGDNACFLPPPGVITLDTDPSGQYSDVTELFATLNDADGSPVQNATVTAVLTGGKAISAKTDNDGIADLKLPLLVPAGAKTLTVAFAGDGVVGPAKATKTFTVALEKTLLKAVASRGGATATVIDNDKHPVVGRYVTFTIGTTKRLVKTNSRGVAVLTGLKKGTAVKVAFLAVKGYYLGTPTYTVKAL